MRVVLVTLAALAAAGASRAQVPLVPRPVGAVSSIQLQTQIDMMRAQLDIVRQQQIGMGNQVSALDASARTERNLALLHDQAHPGPAPVLRPGAAVDAGQYVSIPDALLADSDAKVRAAAGGRR